MLLNLYDVLSVSGKNMVYSCRLEEQTVDFQGETLQIPGGQPFDVKVAHTGKDMVSVDMQLSVETVRSCSRCLEEINCSYALSIHRTIDVARKEAYEAQPSEADTISYIEDCTLDVDMLVLDELFTVLPMNVLCQEDCKGICKVCGINLNKSTCNCDQTVPDPRMAVFSDIFNQFKEV